MSRRLQGRLDLVMVTLLCFFMTGCLAALRREPAPDIKRLVYLGIDKAPPAIEQAVAKHVDPGYERVSADAYREAARKLQAETMTDLDVARVARELDVDVVIHGRYVRKNKRRGHVEVLMRTAAMGAIVGDYVIPVRRGVMSKRGERKLENELRTELATLLGPPAPAPAEPTEAVAAAETSPEPEADRPESVVEKNARAESVVEKNARAESEKKTRAQAAPALVAAKPAPAPVAAKPAPAPVAAKPAPAPVAKPAPAPVAAKPAPAPIAKAPAVQASRVSEKPAAASTAVVQNQPVAPAPVIRTEANGQVIDDEQPPGL
jgi:hypothetical protein